MNPINFVRRSAAGAFIAVFAVVALMPSAAVAATTEFPAGYENYHTYAETVAAIDAAVAAHPGIIRKFSIGTSYLGRTIWAVKISDHVATDENEPEIMFDSLVHAREHITVEMDLYLMRLLVNNYGTDTQITKLVNTREIYIVFMVNPDGGEYDISNGKFHMWRKNRQPAPNSTQIGTDINRNFGFQWGCCNGSSSDPSKETYRGPYAWSAPETVAYRNFIRSRVVNGVQQLKIVISWHSSGKYVLWPWSYTNTALADVMTSDDHSTFVALGQHVASLNGYTAQQASKLYIADGVQHDWGFHEQHLFHFTIEMGPGGAVNFYPTQDKIKKLTHVNRSAVLYLIGMADCPYRAAGLATAHCGAAVASVYLPPTDRLGPIPV